MREILIRGGDDGSAGIFDVDKRLESLSAKGDQLEAIDRLIPWECFASRSKRWCSRRTNSEEQRRPDSGCWVPVPTQLRARSKIGLQNLAYNVRRIVPL